MGIKDDIVNAKKKVLDNTVGLVNRGKLMIVENTTFGNSNMFDCIMWSPSFSKKSIKSTIMSNAVMQTLLRSVTIQQEGLEFELMGIMKQAAKTITNVETVTFKFLETDLSLLRNWIDLWQDDVYDKATRMFRDDQASAKRNAVLIPQMREGVPTLFWYKMEGLTYKSTGDITYDQDSGEVLTIEVICAVDRIKTMAPSTSLF